MALLSRGTVRASLAFFLYTAVGLPVWVVLLFPTRADRYLLSPVTWLLVAGTWLLLTVSFSVAKRVAA